jgi:enediyne biosynthesis protein E4
MKKYLFYFFSISAIFSCKNKQDTGARLFQLMENTGINFTNKVVDGSLENGFLFRNFYNGSGVATGDVNNDGLADVFLTSNTAANKLYLNKGDFKFEDVSKSAGIIADDKWNTGVVFADVNADGWLDIYVCSSGHMGTGTRKNKLYINNQNLTFTESAAKYGLDIAAYTTQVSFFDFDLDGDLDCFMINNSPIPINQLGYANKRDLPDSLWKIPDFLKGGGDHLYRNDNGLFKEITSSAGIHGGLISFGLGVSVSDINNDGWPDVFVSNDSYERDYLYINQQNGTFKDEMEEWFQHTSFSSMGADIADINNDGYQDLFTTDMLPMNEYRLKTTGSFDNISLFNTKFKSGFYYQYTKNCLQLNNKNRKFIDIARYSGVVATDWSWGALIFDMDNDGWNDLYVCNGVAKDVTDLDFMDFFANDAIQKMVLTGRKAAVDEVLKEIPLNPLPNKVYKNNKDLTFTDVGADWGMAQPTFSNGAAYADLDNDGDLDLLVCNTNQPSFIYKNQSREINKNNYIGFTLTGSQKNLFAIGSKVQLFAGGQVFTRELVPSRGFQSSVDYKLIFGLGTQSKIDSAIVTWPDRTVTQFQYPEINKIHALKQSTLKTKLLKKSVDPGTATIFSPSISNFDKHNENDFVDFYNERLVPRVFSREGPKCATGDVNSDGLEDLYIGGAEGSIGQLYIQNTNGTFTKKEQSIFKQFADFEDAACVFLDYDKDNDEDLLVCPGGNNHALNSRELQLRLFDNDGSGNFSINTTAFPTTTMNIAVAAVNDFNNDGYPDVFAGARSYPGVYGKDPHSFVFLNDTKGHFIEMPEATTAGISAAGMITSAEWADVAGDAKKELIVVGEWMAPRIFSFSKDHFEELKTNIGDKFGWWQSLTVSDVNNDGKQDLLLGNIGENFYLRPTAEQPTKLWMNDYDNNGDLDKIMTYTVGGEDLPVFLKRDVQDQLPSLKKENLRHSDYANKSIQALFSKQLNSKAIVKQFTYPSSCVAINKGNGQFAIQKLPVMVQLSCINAMLPFDVNGDGAIDLVTGGNQFGFLPQFEKLDASFGDVLLNDGTGNFIWQPTKYTGLNLRGELRDIKVVKNSHGTFVLFLQNNEVPLMYKFNGLNKGIF